MMFITPIPPRHNVSNATTPKNQDAENSGRQLCALQSVPDKKRLFIVGVEVVALAQSFVNFLHRRGVCRRAHRLRHKVVDPSPFDTGGRGIGGRCLG
jgi:hypothetical protein